MNSTIISNLNSTVDIDVFITQCRTHINEQLKQCLPDLHKYPSRLHKAMHYSVIGNGKRLRPILVYAAGLSLNAEFEHLNIPATAVELIHCYSLIHDDLPAMDDDDLRRGEPTCHKAFDEATAILAGDALQTLAFELLSQSSFKIPSEYKIRMFETLAKASGSLGMVGGQDLDLFSEGKAIDLEELIHLHQLKTGALIKASIRLGIYASKNNDETFIRLLDLFAEKIGLAFQIQDDILDIESTTQILGKTAGSDKYHQKATYPALTSLALAKKKISEIRDEANTILHQLPFNTVLLEKINEFLTSRKK